MKTNHPMKSIDGGVTVLEVPEGVRGDARVEDNSTHTHTVQFQKLLWFD